MSETTKLKNMLKAQKPLSSHEPLHLHTGSTLLNLACSGDVSYGFLGGHYYYLVGDSASGKTFLALTCLAEASINPDFKKHRFIFDNKEDGALMDIRKFFGKAVADRMEPPAKDEDGQPVFSDTIEELYYNLDDAVQAGEPFIYILDSMDSLSSEAEADKFQEHKEAHRKGKTAPGSYGDGKAKINSSGIRQVFSKLKDTNSILIIISQTRDNLGFGFETKTRSGGRALRFYATVEIWSSCGDAITKTALGKPRKIGMVSELHVKKNRVSGRDRTVKVPIYYAYGMDDIGSCVAYLVDEGHWDKTKGKGTAKIEAPEFEFTGSEMTLIKKVEEEGLVKDLRDIVQDCWDRVEAACDMGRKPRYE